MSMCSYVYAVVQPNKHTHLQKHKCTHTHTHTRSVRMYPRTPIQCQCSVLSPPTSGWSPCQFTCQAWTSRALSAPERPPSPPPIHTHCVTQGQGGFTHAPVPSLPSIARCHPCARLDNPCSLSHSRSNCYICKRLLPAASHLIYSGVLKGTSFRVDSDNVSSAQ